MSRLEHDFLGELTIDDSVYYGVQTLRAMNNFHISGTPLSQFPEMIWALACVKKACALANMELQVLPRDIGRSCRRNSSAGRYGTSASPSVPPVTGSWPVTCSTSSPWTASRAGPVPPRT